MSLLLKNVTVIDPASGYHLSKVNIQISGDQIEAVGPGVSDSADQEIDLEGAYISPGWVDMMVNLSDPGYEWKESISDLARAAHSGGFTQIVCAPNTQPVVDNSQMIHSLQLRSKGLWAELWFTGAATQGAKGEELAEVYDMHKAGAVGFGDGVHPVQKAGIVLRALQYMQSFDGLYISNPEDLSLSHGGQMNEGQQSTLLGLKGIPEIAESLAVNRDLDILNYTSGRMHIQPVTTAANIERIQAARKDFPELTLGTALYYFFLSDDILDSFDPNYKLMPPLRDQQQVEALKECLAKGHIHTLGSGHFPQGLEEKNVQFAVAEPGMLGLQTFFPLANEHLVDAGVIELADLITLISINPRKVLKKPQIVIEEGAIADLTVFNPHTTWTFQKEAIPSVSKNSPFIGKEMKGSVLGTCLKGKWQPNFA